MHATERSGLLLLAAVNRRVFRALGRSSKCFHDERTVQTSGSKAAKSLMGNKIGEGHLHLLVFALCSALFASCGGKEILILPLGDSLT